MKYEMRDCNGRAPSSNQNKLAVDKQNVDCCPKQRERVSTRAGLGASTTPKVSCIVDREPSTCIL